MNLYTSKSEKAAKEGFAAAGRGDFPAVKRLIDSSFNIGDCDEEGSSLLHYAVKGGNPELIRYLVERCGMDPAWANREGVTPWDLAQRSCDEETAGVQAREVCSEKADGGPVGEGCGGKVAGGQAQEFCNEEAAGVSARENRADLAMEEIRGYFERVCGFSHEECYRNPVLRGMHPDPSILRVGEDYYMVNSSFIFFPCIPISHSRDLVHWQVIGHAVTDRKWAEEHLGPLEGGRGFWAPDISYYNGRFYICATLRNNDDAPYIQTQMVTSADRPEGPYDTPVIHNVRGIDPSIFTDDDGKRYMLVNRGARMMEISPDGREILSEPELIWYGHSGKAPEGPHLLKKDGYYYCFLAEGGTGKGHMIAVGRSRNLRGPYEDCPYNPIMTQRDEIASIQCCGHGKPVQTADGRWFMVYLCSRFIDGQWGMLGRETCLDEITWTADGWPLVNRGRGPSYMAKLPFPEKSRGGAKPSGEAGGPAAGEPTQPSGKDKSQAFSWISPRTMDPAYVTVENEFCVEIRGDGRDLCDRNCRSLLVKHQPDFRFSAEFELEWSARGTGKSVVPEQPDAGVGSESESGTTFASETGMVLYYDENTYVKFGVAGDSLFVSEYVDDRYVRTESCPFRWGDPMVFRVDTDGLARTFSLNGRFLWRWEDVTSICSEGLVKGKRFTGAAYGVYVYGDDLLRWRQHGDI